MVLQIASASGDQSRSSEEISRNVDAISKVTGETAQGTQQIAHAAEDLNRLMENLRGLIGGFTVRGTGSRRTTLTEGVAGPRVAMREAGVLVEG